jgi:hypothetical protein
MSSKDKTNEFVLFDKSNPMFVFSEIFQGSKSLVEISTVRGVGSQLSKLSKVPVVGLELPLQEAAKAHVEVRWDICWT